uniref:Testis expressed 36 n=1 Tax=Canis lupus dingo TaxID=286419 RepID=A0A8C0R1T4_CANLU
TRQRKRFQAPFPQIGLTQKTPESSTSAVLKEPHRPHLSRQVEERLPPIYKVREKQAVNNNFPFSVHDNRHSFQSSGCYLDSVSIPLQIPSKTGTVFVNTLIKTMNIPHIIALAIFQQFFFFFNFFLIFIYL